MTTPEGKVRDPVVKWAKDRGIGHIRMAFRPGVRRGTPDDQFLVPGGISVFIEFKRLGKEPTPQQMDRITTMRRLGFIAVWTDNATDGIAAIAHALAAVQAIKIEPSP